MKILHVLDHSIPLHSGYTFRTLSLLREQAKLGWQTCHLTSPKHTAPSAAEETVDGWHFYRTPVPPAMTTLPGLAEVALMRLTGRRLLEVALQLEGLYRHASTHAEL